MEFGIKNIVFIVVFFGALAFFAKNALRLISYLKLAQPENRFDRIGERISRTLTIAIFQSKILRDKKAGPIHAGIFWGFLILLFSALNSIFTGFGIHDIFNYLGPIFTVITLLTDVFISLIIIAVAMALYRRYVLKIQRLQRDQHEAVEAAAILVTIFFIVTSLLFENASMISMDKDASWAFRPVAAMVAGIISPDVAPMLYEISWWIHLVLILSFMNFLPYSKHLHVLTSVPNVFLSNIEPTNKLNRIDFEDESIEQYGVTDVEQFSWKTLLDGYTCTECGRCTSVCPANTTGKVLDPREIIVQIRHRTMDKMPILEKMRVEDEKAKAENREPKYQITEDEQTILDKKLIGDYVNPEALWQCTTCSACMQECPVNIEHVPAIVEMRRSLVMMESEFPSELQLAFGNIENNAAPWAFPQDTRGDWVEDLEVPIAAEKEEFDVLFWVGCAGSFDDRAKKITRAFAQLMNIAGVNFAILGPEETCTGDPARRAGNEYLADMYVKMNVETMNNYKFKQIVATCPHCFNTLKNEYGQFGGNYEVIHHTMMIDQLIKDGRIPISKDAHEAASVVYHDSCYLGRLNDVYDKPRNILQNIPGLNVINPGRSKDRGLCCGAGGAQMFMEENQGKRVNIERTEELLSVKPQTIAVNCPFCMTMISDGVKSKEIENVVVKDISEIVLESISKN